MGTKASGSSPENDPTSETGKAGLRHRFQSIGKNKQRTLAGARDTLKKLDEAIM